MPMGKMVEVSQRVMLVYRMAALHRSVLPPVDDEPIRLKGLMLGANRRALAEGPTDHCSFLGCKHPEMDEKKEFYFMHLGASLKQT